MPPMTAAPFLARLERFDVVGSTNDVVHDWLAAGEPEVCVAVADVQSAGRGRGGRTWTAPSGVALLLSVGFRPSWLAPESAWRLAAVVSLAMAEAAEEIAGLVGGAMGLKWPNDLVIRETATVRKLGGLLGETDGLGGPDPRAVIGIGVNADWRAAAFPPELRATMTSLREVAGSPVDREALLDGFLRRLTVGVENLRRGRFDQAAWTDRQVTTGHDVTIAFADGSSQRRRALGVDATSGALVVADVDHGRRLVLTGEIVNVRLAGAA